MIFVRTDLTSWYNIPPSPSTFLHTTPLLADEELPVLPLVRVETDHPLALEEVQVGLVSAHRQLAGIGQLQHDPLLAGPRHLGQDGGLVLLHWVLDRGVSDGGSYDWKNNHTFQLLKWLLTPALFRLGFEVLAVFVVTQFSIVSTLVLSWMYSHRTFWFLVISRLNVS